MRKTRDGETTKQTVLEAAKTVFAERGFAGASLAMISERAGISSGLILHHFKSKENLYRLVLEDLSAGYYQTILRAANPAERPEQAMQDMLRATFRYWSEDSAYHRISTWAYLENRTGLVNEEARLTAGLAAMIAQMQAQGRFDPRFSPFVLLAMTIGPIQFWARHRALFKEALHLDQTIEELDQVFLEQYLALIQKLYEPQADRAK